MIFSNKGIDFIVEYQNSLSKSLVQIVRDPEDENQIIYYKSEKEQLEVRIDFQYFWANI